MHNRKNIVPFLVLALVISSISLLSFYTPKEKPNTSAILFKISEIKDIIVSAEEQIIAFDTYDLNTIHSVNLVLSGTYGNIILNPILENEAPVFKIPNTFTKYAGSVAYCLFQNEKSLQKGVFRLLSDTTNIGSIENYLGPRSIVANERDYTMLVSIPTDSLGNLLPDGTEIELKTQFKNSITKNTERLSSGFAWKRIPAPLQTGRISTGSTLQKVSSKELIADIFPDLAQDFTISVNSNHNYADGNEIITFQTTQIKDKQGNIITDGTLVAFIIQDDLGAYWQTNATTINGFAFAKTLHPQSPSRWKIRATISGIAKSPKIDQVFVSILDSIPVNIQRNRQLVVGPLTSYLGQFVQDGISVSMQIDGKTYTRLTKNGEVTFQLKKEDHPKDKYTITVNTLGLETIKNIRFN